MFAVTEAVQVAIVAGAATVAAASIPGVIALRQGRDTRRQVEATNAAIGTPNGHGNLVQMAERILAGQAGQDNRLAKLEAGQHAQTERLAAVESGQQDVRTELARIDGRVSTLEQLAQPPHLAAASPKETT